MPQVKQKLPAHKNALAFSLVEVAIAVGIFAFAIVAVVGLLAVTVNSDKGAATDAVLARLTTTTVSKIRGMGFGAVKTNTSFSPGDQNVDFYYDNQGSPTTLAAGNAIFGCEVTRKDTASINLYLLNLKFRWPLAAPSDQQQTRDVTATIANYD